MGGVCPIVSIFIYRLEQGEDQAIELNEIKTVAVRQPTHGDRCVPRLQKGGQAAGSIATVIVPEQGGQRDEEPPQKQEKGLCTKRFGNHPLKDHKD